MSASHYHDIYELHPAVGVNPIEITQAHAEKRAPNTANSLTFGNGHPMIAIGIATDQNPAHRESQQDAAGAGHISQMLPAGYLTMHVIVVCDGVGGHIGGEWASGTACPHILQDILGQVCEITDIDQLTDIMRSACSSANRHLRAVPPQLAGAATTAAICVLIDSEWLGRYIAVTSVGDSRIYCAPRDGSIHPLTRDDSYVQALVDSGTITLEDALVHPDSNVITAALGSAATLPELTITIYEVAGSIAIIALTDGAWGPLQRGLRDGFQPYLSETVWQLSSQKAAEQIVAASIHLGGDDNATAAVLRIDFEDQYQPRQEQTK